MLTFYLDEDIDLVLAPAMQRLGLDVTTTSGTGRRGSSDPDQLAFATGEGRVIVTRNRRDFVILHRLAIERGQRHAGIVAISRALFPFGPYAAALARMSEAHAPEAMANRFEYLTAWLPRGA